MSSLSHKSFKHAIQSMIVGSTASHPKGNTKKMLRRRINRTTGPCRGIAFERESSAPANIWVCALDVRHSNLLHITSEDYPASSLYQLDVKGRSRYGRHSNLQAMSELAESDLIRYTPATIEEAWQIIEAVVWGGS